MTFSELKEYITEAIGEEVVTVDKLIAGVRAGFGDMTHRNYREFKSIFVVNNGDQKEGDPFFDFYSPGLCITAFPNDALELLYVKVFFENNSYQAVKLALSNPSIQANNKLGYFRTDFNSLDYETAPSVVYYKKEKEVYVEWNYEKINSQNTKPITIELGYYQKLPIISKSKLREYANISSDQPLDIGPLEIPIADDYANILVNWMIYYVALSQDWEQERLTVLKNEYKYSMEDLLARKNKEDMYDETVNMQKIDGVL